MNEKEYIIEDDLPEKNAAQTGAWPILFAMGSLLLLGLGVPVLLIYFIKSPPIDQVMPIMGFSYSKLVYIFMVIAAVVTYASVIFLRAKPLIIIPVFVILLYCCFPFIVGLRNNLPIKEAVIDTPLLSHLPFFLKPAYIFFEFSVPAGILICLFLQIKNILSKKTISFAFSSLACFLGTAAVLGFSVLNQAGLPNLASIASRPNKGTPIRQTVQQSYPVVDRNEPQPSVPEITPPANPVRYTIPDKELFSQPDSATPRSTMANAKEVLTIHEIDQKFERLSVKLDHLIEIISQNPSMHQINPHPSAPTQVASQMQPVSTPSASPPATKQEAPPTENDDIEQKLLLVSTKLNGIADTISRIEALLPKQTAEQPQLPNDITVTPSPTQTPIPSRSETTSNPGGTKDIAQELSVISNKVDQILEALSHDKKYQKLLPQKP